MSPLKRVARLAAAAVLATGIFAASAAPSSAAVQFDITKISTFKADTGWG